MMGENFCDGKPYSVVGPPLIADNSGDQALVSHNTTPLAYGE